LARFLFVAPASESWGEFLSGRRIAIELAARGHQITFLVPKSLTPQLAGVPCRIGQLDGAMGKLDHAILSAVQQTQSDALVLVDACLVFMHLYKLAACEPFLRRIDVPLFALDVWDMQRTDLRWDFGDIDFVHAKENLLPTRRLLPVPFINLKTGAPGLYCALPAERPVGNPRAGRDLFAVGDQPVILFASASWQRPAFQWVGNARRLARCLPAWLAELLRRVRSDTIVCHIGPDRFPEWEAALGSRYRHLPQIHPDAFADAMAAADLFLSCNFAATSISTALLSDVPVLLATNSLAVASAADLPADLQSDVALRDWIGTVAPLHRFRVWPYGMHRFLQPSFDDNPYSEAITCVELLQAPAVLRAAEDLLRPGPTRDAALQRQRDYLQQVQRLPRAATLIEGQLP